MTTLNQLKPADRLGRRVLVEKYGGKITARQPFEGIVEDFKFRALVKPVGGSPWAKPQWVEQDTCTVLDPEYQTPSNCKHGLSKDCPVCKWRTP